MDQSMRKFFLVVVAAAGLALSACEKEGPAERAGKSLDNAVENTGEKIENAGEKVQDAADGREGEKRP